MSLIGTKVGHVVLQELLGQGGMGEVYRGIDEKLQRPVAVKTIRREHRLRANAKARFLREARVLSRLDHPGICRVYDLVDGDESDFLILELVDGVTLTDAINGGMSREEQLLCARSVAAALEAAHLEGVAHRDLKPDNIMVTGPGQVKVLDFGIARLVDRTSSEPGTSVSPEEETAEPPADQDWTIDGDATEILDESWSRADELVTRKGALVGTLAYMSPEQACGEELTCATDMYSLGIVLHEMCTGEPAYEDTTSHAAAILQVGQGQTRPVEGLHGELATLIGKLESVEPEKRPSARETKERLDWILDRPRRERRRRRQLLAALSVVVLLVLTAIVSLRLAQPKPLLLPGQEGRVLVLPFVNDTGNPGNDWVQHGLMELLAQTLDATEGVDVVSPQQASQALEARGVASASELDGEEIQRLVGGLGAELGLVVRLESSDDRYLFHYATHNVAGSVGQRQIAVDDLTIGANLLARRIAHRLRPDSTIYEVWDRFSDQPLVNRVYAMGVESLHSEGAAAGHPFFEVALHRDPEMQWARIKLAECQEILGERDGSEELALQVLEAARSTQRYDLVKAALLHLALQKRRTGDYDQAEGFYRQVLEDARLRDDRAHIANSIKGLGALAYFRGDLEAAQELFEEGLVIYREIGDRTGEMHSIGNLSAVADAQGDTKRAEELDLQSVTIARETGHLQGLADNLNNLGVSYRYQGRYKEAHELYLESLDLQRRLGNRQREANTLHNLGDLAKEQGQLVDAQDYTRQALEIFQELEDHVGIGRASVNLAELLLLEGKLEEAIPHMENAESWDPESSLVIALRALEAYQQGRFAEARQIQERARKAADADWREAQGARLQAFAEAERRDARVPLPLESPL